MMLLYIIAVLQLLSLTGASESGIVGGEESKPHSRPYMAELQVRGHHTCGGILIRKDFVLTSAHCHEHDDMLVVLGAHNIAKNETSQQKIPVAEYHPHPKFDVKTKKYDIMLLKLKTNAKLNVNVMTIGLPKKDEKLPAQTECLVMGWGRTGPKTPPSEALRETKVKIEFSDECKHKWGEYFARDQMICTKANKKTNVGIQQGDSGGPLVCGGKVHGISAFVDDHYDWRTDKYRPNVFIEVSFFIQWIETVMKR